MFRLNVSFQENDILNRKFIVQDIINCISIIRRSNVDGAVSIGINSKWGSGKTFFMNMWKTELENQGDKVIIYDAWENDDCGSAILPILYSIVSITTDSMETAYIQYVKNFFKTVALETSKFGIKKFFGEDSAVSEILENGISALSDDEIKTIFKQYGDYYGDRKTLEDTLNQIVSNCQRGLWIFIDDLDRCEPNFAISTLECIKHFFNIKNVTYVFSVDIEQLQNTASTVYGGKIDTNSYLKRFFDYIYDMPDPDTNTYIKCMVEKMDIDDSLKQYVNSSDISRVSRHFQCSLRDLNLILMRLEIFLSDNKDLIEKCDKPDETLKIYYYFIIIKDKFRVDYNKIIHGDYSIELSTGSHRGLIDKKFLSADDKIKSLLIAISEGQGNSVCTDIFKKYSLFPSDEKTFKKHMQLFIK